MNNRFLFACLWVMLLPALTAKAFQVTPHTQISLITAGPGPELYTIFGHNALRIKDTSQHTDVFFNYGTFDFNTPGFYFKFVRGHLNYMLSAEDYQSFMYTYVVNGQWLKEQVLNLTMEQKQKICNFIENNYKPENRFYRYDFYYDNCATRIRDVIFMACNDSLVFRRTGQEPEKTIRQYLDSYLEAFPWIHLGVDLVMGLPADRLCDIHQEMFLPELMMQNLATASCRNQPLISETFTMLEGHEQPVHCPFLLKPVIIFWALFVLSLWIFFRAPERLPLFQRIWFTFWGIIGIIIAFMWFFTDHQATKMNLNLFWLCPAHFLVWLPHCKTKIYYFQLVALLIILTFTGWVLGFYPQGIHPAFLPLWLISLVLAWQTARGKSL